MAKATIGALNARLSLNSAKFTAGLKKASARLKTFGKGVARVAKRIAKFGAAFAALGGAAAIAGLTIFVKRSMQAIDATAKLADRLGATTEGLVGLQHAAEITGASAETLNKGLEFMAKSLGEASTGVGEAKQALELLNLKYSDLIFMRPEEAFIKIAEAMRKQTSQSVKMFVASRLWGRSGLKLVNMAQLGAKGLAEMSAEAVALGRAFTRIDAAKVEAANDAIARLKGAMMGLSNIVAIKMSPWIEFLARRMTEFIKNLGFKRKLDAFFAWIKRGVVALANWISNIWAHILEGLATFVWTLAKTFQQLGKRFMPLARTLAHISDSLEWSAILARQQATAKTWGQKIVDTIDDISDSATAAAERIAAMVDATAKAQRLERRLKLGAHVAGMFVGTQIARGIAGIKGFGKKIITTPEEAKFGGRVIPPRFRDALKELRERLGMGISTIPPAAELQRTFLGRQPGEPKFTPEEKADRREIINILKQLRNWMTRNAHIEGGLG
ncbi:MAG: hypothetical protein ACE5FM_00085 [Methyloligellaceae bacterium]